MAIKAREGGGGTLQAEHIPVTAGEGEQQKGAPPQAQTGRWER